MKSTTHKQSNARKGFLLALASTAVISTNYVTAKYALKGFDAWTFSVIWCAAAAVYTFIILLVTGRAREIIISRRSFWAMLYLGLITAAGMILTWAGLRLLEPALAAFLWRFGPILTITMAAIFLSEKLTARIIGPAVVIIAGGLMSTLASWDIVAMGTALTILACVAAAGQRLIAKIQISEMHPNIVAFYRVFFAAVALAGLVLATGKADFDIEGKYWAAVFVGAFLGPCVGHLLMFRSFVHWDLSRTSIVLTAGPLFVLPMAYLAFGKLPTGMALFGGFIILAGAFWLAIVNR